MSYLVCLTRLPNADARAAELGWLAEDLGLGPVEARTQFAGEPPLILPGKLDRARAQARLARLRARGLGAVAVDAAALPNEHSTLVARSLRLHADGFSGGATGGGRFGCRYAELLGIVEAVEVREESGSVEVTTNKLSLTRALRTGGLMPYRHEARVETRHASERERVAFVFQRRSGHPLLLREQSMSYELGARQQPTRQLNFAALVQSLRAAAPAAIHDTHLVRARRRPQLSAIQGGVRQRALHTNATENAVAAYLIMHAHLQEQL